MCLSVSFIFLYGVRESGETNSFCLVLLFSVNSFFLSVFLINHTFHINKNILFCLSVRPLPSPSIFPYFMCENHWKINFSWLLLKWLVNDKYKNFLAIMFFFVFCVQSFEDKITTQLNTCDVGVRLVYVLLLMMILC